MPEEVSTCEHGVFIAWRPLAVSVIWQFVCIAGSAALITGNGALGV